MHKRKLSAVIIVLALSLAGCAAMNPATGKPTAPYGIASRLADDIALTVSQSDATVDAWRVQGLLDQAEERNILGWSNLVNVVNAQFIGCIRIVHTQAKANGYTACAKSLAAGIGDPATLTALHVTNPKSQANVTAMANTIVSLVTNAITTLGGQ
jgi:hypothetical protein